MNNDNPVPLESGTSATSLPKERAFYAPFGDWLRSRSPLAFRVMRLVRRSLAKLWTWRVWTVPLLVFALALPFVARNRSFDDRGGLAAAIALATVLAAVVYLGLVVDDLRADTRRRSHTILSALQTATERSARTTVKHWTQVAKVIDATKTGLGEELRLQIADLESRLERAYSELELINTSAKTDLEKVRHELASATVELTAELAVNRIEIAEATSEIDEVRRTLPPSDSLDRNDLSRDRGFARAARLNPWPRYRPHPDLEVVGREANGLELVTSAVRELRDPLILEIGAEFGGSTRRWLEDLPESRVVCVDPWLDRYPPARWPEIANVIDGGGTMMSIFHAFCWPYRHRIAPVRGFSPQVLSRLARLGVDPSVVYVDGDHRYESVLVDMAVAGALWPDAVLCGDDWNFSSTHSMYRGMELPVRHAVKDFCDIMNHDLMFEANTWLIDRH